MIVHPVDHHASGGHIDPDGKRKPRDPTMFFKTLMVGKIKCAKQERNDHDSKNGMSEKDHQKQCPHPIIARKPLMTRKINLQEIRQ